MKTRCYNKKSDDYYNYGGRGIKVCDRWLGEHGFENFLSDMGYKPTKQHSLDRFPNMDGDYEPINCRWATIVEQARNKRNVKLIECKGGSMILQDWANLFGVHQANLMQSIKAKGMDDVYDFYYKKHRGIFPNGTKFVCNKTKNYNLPKGLIAFKDSLPVVIESKSIREMSRRVRIHHHIIETSAKNNSQYKGWRFEFL